ncbi:uncharacterized protein LOC133841416 [Drosophila sulfurigaster albostrigata]|uniref:uncharacterized protein LOC133841416 n=1 Tax=Drosophila sulfurigaster albostrigata TaxID=89887 RepID=UPI002D2188BF|nr:uncharacterized protein LOC133841416 [Drosophila sulfurigaster albostrigata]
MLLDAIIWLPTLFTYIVFLLILIILFFIVAYVSHKIYISIYDNLPLPAAPLSRSSIASRSRSTIALRSRTTINARETSRGDHMSLSASSRSIWIQNRSAIYEASTVVRVTLTLEPCYLVSIGLDILPHSEHRAVSFLCNCQDKVAKCAATAERDIDSLRILRYYDQLSKVPRLKLLLRCCERKNMHLVLDDVIKDVMENRGIDNTTACRAPTRRTRLTEVRSSETSERHDIDRQNEMERGGP